MPTPLTPAQLRGARGMLGWSMLDLSKAAKVSVSTVKRMEGGASRSLSDEIQLMVRLALERAGTDFLGDEAHGVGIVLKRAGAGGVPSKDR